MDCFSLLRRSFDKDFVANATGTKMYSYTQVRVIRREFVVGVPVFYNQSITEPKEIVCTSYSSKAAVGVGDSCYNARVDFVKNLGEASKSKDYSKMYQLFKKSELAFMNKYKFSGYIEFLPLNFVDLLTLNIL